MNELLNNWKSKASQQFDNEENNELRRRRRMTTTIGRSIEIQTEQKICQEKGISTDGNFIVDQTLFVTLIIFHCSSFQIGNYQVLNNLPQRRATLQTKCTRKHRQPVKKCQNHHPVKCQF